MTNRRALVLNSGVISELPAADALTGAWAPRINSQASASTITPDIASYDGYDLSALAADLAIENPTGTPYDFQAFYLCVKDDGTARTFDWGDKFRATDGILPSGSTPGQFHWFEFRFNSAADLYLLVKYTVISSTEIDPDAAAYIAAMTVEPDSTRISAISTLIADLKADGIWAKLDWLSLFATHDAQAARLNAINPAQAFSVVGSPTFTVDSGYTGAGSSYLNSGWDPSNDGVNFLRDSASMGLWSLTNVSNAFSAMGSENAHIAPLTSGYVYCKLNETSYTYITNTDSSGMISTSRSGSTAGKGYRNGVSLGTTTRNASVALDTYDIFALARNQYGSATSHDTARTYAAMFWGGNLSDTEHADFYTHLSAYLTAVGAI